MGSEGGFARVDEKNFYVFVGDECFGCYLSLGAAEGSAKRLNEAAEKWRDEAVRAAAKEVSHRMKEELRAIHGLAENCKQEGGECSICSFIDCPFSDSLHYHHDGCPSEYMADGEAVRAAEDRVWEEAAKIVCVDCSRDIPIVEGDHRWPDDGLITKCYASALRARRAGGGK